MQDHPTKPKRKSPRPSVVRTCEICNNPFRAWPSTVDRSAARYCGRKCAGLGKSKDMVSRFWENVQKTDTCWIWTGIVTVYGYGSLPYRDVRPQAHRVSWEIHNGPIPRGMCVLHNCPGGDNRRCVNPAHLWLGTRTANSQDMANKGRSTQGSRHPRAKLTEIIVAELRRRHEQEGISTPVLAAEVGVGKRTMRAILHRYTWRHVP